MNEFKALLREAFLGEEPFDPAPGRAALLASARSLEDRERVLRRLMWLAVTLMTAVAAWGAWSFFTAGDGASVKRLVLAATAFLFGVQGVGTLKMSLFSLQKDLSVLKELKRVQLMLLERAGAE